MLDEKEGPLGIKVFLGMALLLLGIFLLFGSSIQQNKLEKSSFADEPVKVEGFHKVQGDKEKKKPDRIIIPDLRMDILVKESRIINGYWEVFPDSAGWGEGSGFLGESGNQVIFAHARKGLFLALKNVKEDMTIYVFHKGERFDYKVVEIKIVLPSDLGVIAPAEEEILTLYTCSGFADSKRLIVKAKRI